MHFFLNAFKNGKFLPKGGLLYDIFKLYQEHKIFFDARTLQGSSFECENCFKI
jgi:hypothetical protein